MAEERGLIEEKSRGLKDGLFPGFAAVILVLDEQGTVLDVCARNECAPHGTGDWIGKAWTDNLSTPCRAEVTECLRQARHAGDFFRQIAVTHSDAAGAVIEMDYTLARLPQIKLLVAVGRPRAVRSAEGGASQALADDLLSPNLLQAFLTNLPEAFVAVDATGHILMANEAFIQLVAASSEEHVRFLPVERWLGSTEDDARAVLARMAAGEAVVEHPTVLWTEAGRRLEVDLTAVPTFPGAPSNGLMIRKRSSLATLTRQ